MSGFTGHKNPMIHLRMLELADQRGVKFDTVQMPLNAFDATFRSFEQQVLPEAQSARHGRVGHEKSGRQRRSRSCREPSPSTEALRYAMSLPVATTISGIDSLNVLRQNLGVARDFKPMTAQEMQALRERCASPPPTAIWNCIRSTKRYDADVGRQQHGYPDDNELPI